MAPPVPVTVLELAVLVAVANKAKLPALWTLALSAKYALVAPMVEVLDCSTAPANMPAPPPVALAWMVGLEVASARTLPVAVISAELAKYAFVSPELLASALALDPLATAIFST